MISERVARKAKIFLRKERVKKVLETENRKYYEVLGQTEKHSVIYDKIKKKFFCDCKYWSLKQKDCSHIIAIKMKYKIKA